MARVGSGGKARIASGPLESVTLLHVEPGPGGSYKVLLNDGVDGLIAIDWQPGAGFDWTCPQLGGPIPANPASVSASGRTVVVAGSGESIHLIDRVTDAVARVPLLTGPAMIMSDGKALVSATARGLLVSGLEWTRDAALPVVTHPSPLLVTPLDQPRAMVCLSGPGEGIDFAIACFGRVITIHFERFPTMLGVMRDLEAGLPFDPFHIVGPVVADDTAAHMLFVRDWGWSGIAAIDPARGFLGRWPETRSAYHTLWDAVPAIDRRSVLLALGDGSVVTWVPGTDPRPSRLKQMPLVWQGNCGLFFEPKDSVLSERQF
jgi:hypothetical protein